MPLPPKPSEIKPPAVEPVKGSLDDLISELQTPRQDLKPPLEPGQEGNQPVQPSGGIPGAAPGWLPESPVEQISDETARAAGEQIAGMLDYGSSTVCGLISGEDSGKYKFSAGEKRDLTTAYAAVAKKYSFSGADPVLWAVILTLLVVGPNIKEAFQDRRINKLNNDFRELEARVSHLQKVHEELSNRVNNEQSAGTPA